MAGGGEVAVVGAEGVEEEAGVSTSIEMLFLLLGVVVGVLLVVVLVAG